MMPSFVIPANSGSPDSIDRKRRMAAAMMAQGMNAEPIQHWSQGVSKLAQTLVGGLAMRKADKDESEGRKGANDALLRALSGGQGVSQGDDPQGALVEAMNNPFMSPQGSAMALDMWKRQNTPPDPMADLERQHKEMQIEKMKADMQTAENGGANKVFGTIYFDDKSNPYVLDDSGRMRPPDGIGEDTRIMAPFDKSQDQAAGKLSGDAPRYVVDEYVKKIRPAMTATAEAMSAVSQAKQLLNRGIETGSGAEVFQALRGWGATVGLNVDESILSNTQAYQNFIGNVVIPKMQQLGGNDSNEEMRKMYSLSGGDIGQAQEALRLTVEYTEKLLQKRMADYQSYEKVALPYLGGLPSVPSTSGLGADSGAGVGGDLSTMSDEELEAIINGK